MSFSNLLIADAEGIRTITINRPEQLNALNRATISELDQALDQAEPTCPAATRRRCTRA